MPEDELERSILKEFGRCLEQIIESASSSVLQQQKQNVAKASPNKAKAEIWLNTLIIFFCLLAYMRGEVKRSDLDKKFVNHNFEN